MRRLAAIAVLLVWSAGAPAQIEQSFPGVAPPNPVPPFLPVPPPAMLQVPPPSRVQPPRTDSFSDRVRDCLHATAPPHVDRQGRDRDTVVRECAQQQ